MPKVMRLRATREMTFNGVHYGWDGDPEFLPDGIEDDPEMEWPIRNAEKVGLIQRVYVEQEAAPPAAQPAATADGSQAGETTSEPEAEADSSSSDQTPEATATAASATEPGTEEEAPAPKTTKRAKAQEGNA